MNRRGLLRFIAQAGATGLLVPAKLDLLEHAARAPVSVSGRPLTQEIDFIEAENHGFHEIMRVYRDEMLEQFEAQMRIPMKFVAHSETRATFGDRADIVYMDKLPTDNRENNPS